LLASYDAMLRRKFICRPTILSLF